MAGNQPEQTNAEDPETGVNTGNKENMDAMAQDEQIVSSEPQPVTPSCAVEAQNTKFQARNRTQPAKGPPVIELDIDDVEGIIEPLNKTTIEDNQEPTKTPISGLGQLRVDLTRVDLKKVKKLKPFLTKASLEKNW